MKDLTGEFYRRLIIQEDGSKTEDLFLLLENINDYTYKVLNMSTGNYDTIMLVYSRGNAVLDLTITHTSSPISSRGTRELKTDLFDNINMRNV